MKSFRNLLTIVSLALVSNFSYANDANSVKKPEGAQIQTLLNSIDFDKYVAEATKVNISFFINSKNEIIVVSTNNNDLDRVIKGTLNYSKIAVNDLEYNKVYTVPVRIK